MPITGKVKWFDPGRGYGFISRDDGEGEIFVHRSAIQGEGLPSLNEGDRVEFEVVQGQKGPAAENVTKLTAPEELDVPAPLFQNGDPGDQGEDEDPGDQGNGDEGDEGEDED